MNIFSRKKQIEDVSAPLDPGITEGIEEEIEDTSDDAAAEPLEESTPALPPERSKEDEKNYKRGMKRIVRHLRFRSFGMDILALGGAAACVLLALTFEHPWIGLGVGTGTGLAAGGIMLLSWGTAGREVKRMGGDHEEQTLWRGKVWTIGIRTLRLLAVLMMMELSLLFILFTGSRVLNWQRWVIFGAEFAVLCMILLVVLHPYSHGIAIKRGALEEDAYDRGERRIRRRTGWIWRLLGLVLIVAAGFGQVMFNREVSWFTFEQGTAYQSFDELKTIMEKITPDTPPEGGQYYNELGELVTRDEFCTRSVRDREGNVLFQYRHLNTDIVRMDVIFAEDGSEPDHYRIYSRKEQDDGCWKLEMVNRLWLAAYVILILLCYGGYQRRVKPKLRAYEEEHREQ